MDVLTVAAMGAPVLGAVITAGAILLARRRARRREQLDYLRALPPGSRVVDLGEHGLVVEVGSPASTPRYDAGNG